MLLPSRTGRRALAALVACLTAAGCGSGERPASWDPKSVPAEYRPFVPDGKQAPTGNPALDHWVGLNVPLALLRKARDPGSRPGILRAHAQAIREASVAGVPTDLIEWGLAVADLLDGEAAAADAGGRAGRWQRDRDRLAAEGRSLRDALSRRSGREFPPPQL